MSKITQNEIEQNLLNGWISVSGSWAYASADAPTFTITVPSGASSIYGVGMRIKLTQTTVKYFIITAVADTVLTVYGGTDYTLANAAITSTFYSIMKASLGFPLQKEKWTVTGSSGSASQANPVAGTWYNIGGSIEIPIGSWDVIHFQNGYCYQSGAGYVDLQSTLSTANNTESDSERTMIIVQAAVIGDWVAACSLIKPLTIASKATYYNNLKTAHANVENIQSTKALFRVVCNYL